MVFFQAHFIKKKNNNKQKQIGDNLVPSCKIFAAFSLCTSQTNWKQKAMKNKDKKQETTLWNH